MSRVWPFKILANATSHREIVRSAITSHRSKPAHTACPRSGTYIFPSFLASNNVAVRAASGSDTITLQFYLWMMNTAYYSNDRHDDCKSIYRIHLMASILCPPLIRPQITHTITCGAKWYEWGWHRVSDWNRNSEPNRLDNYLRYAYLFCSLRPGSCWLQLEMAMAGRIHRFSAFSRANGEWPDRC